MVGDGVGENLRSCRLWRGLSQTELAGLSGLSQAFISMVETGKRSLDRRSDLTAVAEALRVSVADLTGQPYQPVDEGQSEVRATVAAVRLALMSTSLDERPDLPGTPLGVLRAETARLGVLKAECRDAELGAALPRLLYGLHRAVQVPRSRHGALRSLVLAMFAAETALRRQGFAELAWLAAERGRRAAELLGDEVWVAASDFPRAHALFAVGAYERGRAVATRAADAVSGQQGRVARQVYGMLRLTEGFARTATGGHGVMGDYLDEVEQVAARTGEGNAFNMAFGPTNVRIWRVSGALEAGDPERAVQVARTVRPDAPVQRARHAVFRVDFGRALVQLRGSDEEAVRVLRSAEDLAPQTVQVNPFAREAVTVLLRRELRGTAGRELRGLAYRMGLAHRPRRER